MRVLITGVTGFAGSHLAEFLLGLGDIDVFGLRRSGSKERNIAPLGRKVRLYTCDLTSPESARPILEDARPHRIFHLAAMASGAASWRAPRETMMTNILLELHLFEAVRQAGLKPRIHIASSSEEYGKVLSRETPIGETADLRPLSPYGVSKVAQDLLGYQYFHTHRLPIVRTRAFNHTGPRQREEFVASDFARQVALIEAGLKEPVIYVGDLGAVRDFTDVRDVVKAYWLALEKGAPGDVYNVCSGVGRRIGEILDIFLKQSPVKIKVKRDPRRLRASEVPVSVGNPKKFMKRTGWRPEIPFEATLTDLLNDWRTRIELDPTPCLPKRRQKTPL